MKKRVMAIFCAAALTLSLAACGGSDGTEKEDGSESSSEDSSESSSEDGEELTTIRLAAGDAMKEELINAVKEDFEAKGYTLEVSVIEDPIASNNAIEEGSLEANFIQHIAYMNNFNEENNGTLAPVGDAIYYPCMGLYSNKLASVDEIGDGMKIGIPRDPTNRSRALRFLEAEGLIELKEGFEEYSQLEIETNKFNLELTEVDSESIPTILDDLDAGVCYPIAMKEAGKDPEASLAFDPPEIGAEYGILIAVSDKNKDAQWAKDLQEAMSGEKANEVITEYFGTSAVHCSAY